MMIEAMRRARVGSVGADTPERVCADLPGGMLAGISGLPGLHLMGCDLDDGVALPLVAARAALSPGELARAGRFLRPLDAGRFMRGRLFLRCALGAWLGAAPQDVALTEEKGGKPVLAGRARGPWFNLSHAGPCMVLALSETAPVGIDLEAHERSACMVDLAAAFLSAREVADWGRRADADTLLRAWTAKEAALKLSGTGLARDPRDIDLVWRDGGPVAVPALGAALLPIPVGGHVCTLAVPEQAR